MNASEFLLSVIAACGGVIRGRTMLQKKSFFVSLLSEVPIELAYKAYFYGPYSAMVDGTLTQLKALGFVEEATSGFGISGGFEMRRYDYTITEDGKKILEAFLETKEYRSIEAAVLRIREAGDPDYMELSIAAKAFFILRRQEKEMSTSELQREAEKFNWKIEPQSLTRAIDFLKHLGLATS